MSEQFDHFACLSPADQAVLDALIEAEFDIASLEPMSDEQRQRAHRILQLLDLMNDYPMEDPDDSLVDAIMLRVKHTPTTGTATARIGPDADVERVAMNRTAGRRLRIPDFISVAAVLLIVASIALPTLNHVRQRSVDISCENNMRLVGTGLNQYAQDHNGAMPMMSAGFGMDGQWINIAPLVSGGYCSEGHVNCPGHHQPLQPSFSYQLQPADGRQLARGGSERALLGDRNPLIDAAKLGHHLSPLTNSFNHNQRGQNILMADNSTRWLDVPIVNGSDNIWLPGRSANLTEIHPDDIDWDVLFLAH